MIDFGFELHLSRKTGVYGVCRRSLFSSQIVQILIKLASFPVTQDMILRYQRSRGRRRSGSKADQKGILRTKCDRGVRYLAIEREAVISFSNSSEVTDEALYESLSSRLYARDMIQEPKVGVENFCFNCLKVYQGSRIRVSRDVV